MRCRSGQARWRTNSDQIFYLNRFAVAAIYAITVPGQPRTVILATATDIRKSLSWYVRRYAALFHDRPCDVAWAIWCERAAAGRIVEAVARHARGGPVNMDLPSVVAAVEGTARRYGVGLKPHDAVLASVAASVERVAEKVEASASNGTLAEFNAAYRAKRLEAQAAGKRFPTYASALAKLNRATIAAKAGAPLSLSDAFD